ncbi:MAG: hypothetical protein ACJ77K_07735 [Bacteroidia bacterium]
MELEKNIPAPFFPDTSSDDAVQEMLTASGSMKTSELFFAMSKNFICIFGFDGYLKKVSSSFVKASGYSSEELLSAPFDDFVVRREKTSGVGLYSEMFFCCRSNHIMKIKWRRIPDLGEENEMMVGWEMKEEQ